MSWRYASYDHAEWLQSNITASKQMAAREAQGRRRRRASATRGWGAAPDEMSPFHRQVAHILGVAFGGIYNAPVAWDSVEWSAGSWPLMHVPVRGGMATFDGSAMTALVFLAHEACIRVAVAPWAPGHMRLTFTRRQRDGGTMDRHPTLEERVAEFRAAIGTHHPVQPPTGEGGR